MKNIQLLISGFLVAGAMVCHAQTMQPGWYKAADWKPVAPSGGSAADSSAIHSAGQFQPLFVQPTNSIAEAITPEIQALANGLEDDPTRIFDYVHDHIQHVLYYGSKKGAQLTLLERSGNDFDQCALLVALLQAAGYTNCGYQFGVLKMPYDSPNHNDLHHWLALSLVNTNWSNTSSYINQLLFVRGYPSGVVFDEGDNNTLAFQRIWVTNTIGGTNYYLDPAFKISEPVAGINLAAALNVSSNGLMTAAGGTSTANYVQSLNEGNLRTTLQTYNTNLLSTIQSNYPNASVQQILGGEQITPWTNGLSQSLQFPIDTRSGLYPVLGWPYQPTAFMSTFAISFGAISNSWYFPQLQGQPLSLTFNSNGLAQIWLQDTLIAQTNTTGSTIQVNLTANHPYGSWSTVSNIPVDLGGFGSGGKDFQIANTYQCTNASYGIIYAFEPNDKWLSEREHQLDAYRQEGFTNSSRQVVNQTLNVMGLNWMLQTKMSEDLLDQQLGILPQYHERVGRMAQEIGRGYYVDIYMQLDGLFPKTGNNPADFQNNDQAFDLSSYFASAMEHGLIEQLQTNGLVAASTVKLLEMANTNNQAIYLANSANWTTGANVSAHLVNYNMTTLNNLISQGYNLLLPTNGSIRTAGAGSWAGSAYVEQLVSSGSETIGMIIGGGYSGGFASDPTITIPVLVNFISTTYNAGSTFTFPQPVTLPPIFNADPVNMADGTFEITAADMTDGDIEPEGLNLTRYYSPERRSVNPANQGNGWVNSYYFNLVVSSAPEVSLGSTTPAQMAPMLVATCSALNTYNPQLNPKNWLVTSLIAKWAIDQITGHAVSVTLGNDTLQFIKQPDGTFTPPANCTWALTNTGTYQLMQRHGNTFSFNSSNLLSTITNQSGDTLSLTYSGGNLSTASGSKGLIYYFTYSGTPSRLTSVSDDVGRSVSYGYSTNVDKNLDLTSYTDPEGKTSTFLYDTNHQIVASYDALGRLVVSNIYDGFGHIVTQYTQGSTNKTWNIFWSDWETVSQDPAGNKQRYFYDDKTRLIGQQDALGNLSQTVCDGQDHPVMTISPLNETNQSIYDGYNDIIYSIDPLGFTNQFVYDNLNNLVKTIDARGNVSTFGYNSRYLVTASTNGAGQVVTYTYNTDGTMATKTDAGGTTSYSYTPGHHLLSITYPGGLGTEGFKPDAYADVLIHTNANGFVTVYQYNERLQLTNTVGPTNLTVSVLYDAIGNTVSSTDARGFTTSNTWSVTRHLLSTLLPPIPAGTALITNAYDNRDWLVKTLNPLSQPTYYTNDAAQRLVSVTDPLNRTVGFGYDADGRKLSTTNALQQATLQQYDTRGSQVSVADPAGRTARYAFDGAGNQIILTNRNGNKWQFQFDGANRLTNTITPLGRTTSQLYNNRGLLATNTDPAGQVQSFTYDPLGRLTNRTDNVATTAYRYDTASNPTNLIEAGRTNIWRYDAYNRVVGYTDVAGNQIQYQYDANGNVTNLIYPGGKNVYYAYDGQNNLTNVTDWSNRKTVMTYDLAGQLTSITRPNGTVRTISYDAAGQTTNISETTPGGRTIAFYKLGWDNAARMQTEYGAPLPHTATVPTRNMVFDADNRLTSIDGNAITMDLDGNMTSGPLTNDTLVSYTFDARNRLTSAGGLSYTYDAANNRTAVTNGATVTKYVINPNAKLPQVLMRVQNGVTNYYVYGAGLLYQVTEAASGTNTLTYHYDYRGSTVALTDGTGTNVTDRIEYSSYATTTYRSGTNDTPFLYNGRYGVMTDANGLLYMRARYYNPYICRFINADPSGFGGGLNLYSYADGNPVSYSDPFGLGQLGENVINSNGFQTSNNSVPSLTATIQSSGFYLQGCFNPDHSSPPTFTVSCPEDEIFKQNLAGAIQIGTETATIGATVGSLGGLLGGLLDLTTPAAAAEDASIIARSSGSAGGDAISLNQVKINLGKAGMSISDYEVVHTPEILDAYGNPAYAAMQQTLDGSVVLGQSGRPLIQISDLGLSSEENAVKSIFHEIHHIDSAFGSGTVSSEAHAEAYAELMYLKYFGK